MTFDRQLSTVLAWMKIDLPPQKFEAIQAIMNVLGFYGRALPHGQLARKTVGDLVMVINRGEK